MSPTNARIKAAAEWAKQHEGSWFIIGQRIAQAETPTSPEMLHGSGHSFLQAELDRYKDLSESRANEIAQLRAAAVEDVTALVDLQRERDQLNATLETVNKEWLPAHDELCRRAEKLSDDLVAVNVERAQLRTLAQEMAIVINLCRPFKDDCPLHKHDWHLCPPACVVNSVLAKYRQLNEQTQVPPAS